MTSTTSTLNGRVTGTYNDYFVVKCPLAPSHLQTLYLRSWQVRSAKVGDLVILAYRATASRGDWVVAEILGGQ